MTLTSYPTNAEQISRGIEQLVLVWHFMEKSENKKKKIPIDTIINILEEAYNDLSDSGENETDFLDRRYRNYRAKLEEKPFLIKMDLKKKGIKNFRENENAIRDLTKIYLESYSEEYSDSIVEKYCSVQKQNGLLEHSLFSIVFFNLAAKLGLTVEITYDNLLESHKKRKRRIIPITLSCRDPYFNLIAFDVNDKIYKYFVLACVTEIHTDIFKFFKDSNRKKNNFNPKMFRNSKDYRFNKEYVTYKIELNRKYLRHIRIMHFPELEILEETKEKVILAITTSDYRYFYNAIFNYRADCTLLSPPDRVAFYKGILQNTLKNYPDS